MPPGLVLLIFVATNILPGKVLDWSDLWPMMIILVPFASSMGLGYDLKSVSLLRSTAAALVGSAISVVVIEAGTILTTAPGRFAGRKSDYAAIAILYVACLLITALGRIRVRSEAL